MRHLEIHLGHLLQDGGRRRGAGGESLDLVVELRMHLFRCVHQQAENDGRAAEMRHPVGVDGAEDVRRADLADQHQRAGHHRHRPGMAPAVAVEHRHDIEICRMLRQRPAGGGPHAHQIGAAMVIDHALGAARGAGSVAKRQRLPLVGRHLPVIVRVACPDEAFVILVADRRQITHRRIADIDHADVLANVGGQRFQRRHHGRGKGGVDDQHAAVAVLEDIGDGLRLEPCIDGVQHTTRHRHAEMRLEHLGRVGGNHRHRVADAEPGPGQRRGQPPHACIALGPCVAALAVNHGGTVRKQIGGAGDETERRQRHEIGVVPRHGLVMLPHGFIPLPGCWSGKAAPGRPHLKEPAGMMTAGR